MKFLRRLYEEDDFIRIRDFLKMSHLKNPNQKNWLIDRWNFCRYMGQIMHGTYNSWPSTIGLWQDESNEIVAIVHSDGEIRRAGKAFFQLGDKDFSDAFISELVDFAEDKFALNSKEGTFINFIVNEDDHQIKNILQDRGYTLQEWRDPMACMEIDSDFKVELPDGFSIVDANQFSDYQKGFAHGQAFGYYKNEVPDDDDAERSFQSLRRAPDYIPELDLSVLDQNGQIAAFAGFWYDELNKIGIIEPVGTVPKHRKMGLGKAVIYEGINRLRQRGAERIFVGSNQEFYLSIGFKVIYNKEIWEKRLK